MEFWYIIEISFLLNIAYRELKSPKTQKTLKPQKNLLKPRKKSPLNIWAKRDRLGQQVFIIAW